MLKDHSFIGDHIFMFTPDRFSARLGALDILPVDTTVPVQLCNEVFVPVYVQS